MKIIRLVTLLDFGGLEQRMVNLSASNDGNEWIFCAIGGGGMASELIEANGKKVILLNQKYKIPSLSAIQKLIEVFNSEKPDLVHTSGAEANFHGIIAAKLAGVKKLVSEEIGIPNQKTLIKWTYKFLYKFSDLVLANSKPVAEYLIQENGVKRNSIQIIPNPLIAIPEKPILQSETEEFQILTVSRIKTVKNIESVLKVLYLLVNENFKLKFTIIGDGDNLENLKKTVSDLKLDSNVDFKGFVPEPFQTVEKTNLFLINSFTEGFSNALVEAMAAGIPCLATNVGAAGELIQDGETGWLIQPGDEMELYEKLKYILSLTKKDLEKVGSKGRASIGEKYSLENHLKQLLEVYQN